MTEKVEKNLSRAFAEESKASARNSAFALWQAGERCIQRETSCRIPDQAGEMAVSSYRGTFIRIARILSRLGDSLRRSQ